MSPRGCGFRLKSYEDFVRLPVPTWGPDLSGLDFQSISYYYQTEEGKYKAGTTCRPTSRTRSEKIGIPQAERAFLAGVIGQYESEGFYQKLRPKWEELGVIFCDTDTAVQKYPEMVGNTSMTDCIKTTEHKLAALHGAVWSGGTFLYVPKGVHIDMPLQTYFRMNARAPRASSSTRSSSSMRALRCSTSKDAPRPLSQQLPARGGCRDIREKGRAAATRPSRIGAKTSTISTPSAHRGGRRHSGVGGRKPRQQVTMLYPCSILKGAARAPSTEYRGRRSGPTQGHGC